MIYFNNLTLSIPNDTHVISISFAFLELLSPFVDDLLLTVHFVLLYMDACCPIKSNVVKNLLKLCLTVSYFLKQLTLKDISTYGNTKCALLTSKKLYTYRERHLKARSSHRIQLDSGINKMCQLTSSTWRLGLFARHPEGLTLILRSQITVASSLATFPYGNS